MNLADASSRPRFVGLKRQFLLLLVAVYLLTGAVALGLFAWGMQGVTQRLAEDFAIQYALRQKDRILAPIQRELALSRKLADSPLLKQWARAEDDPDLKAAALAELDSYRQHFADRSYFFIIDASRHYYHNNAAAEYQGRELRYTIDPGKPEDRWYFATMTKGSEFDLNVNYDASLNVHKVWINVMVAEGGEPLGLGGTGLELDGFVKKVLGDDPPGVKTLLLDRVGAIKAHPDHALIDFATAAKSEAERSTLHRLLATTQEQDRLRVQLTRLDAGQLPVAVLPLTVEGQPYLAAISNLPDIDWFAVVLVDRADLFSLWRFAPFAALLAASLLIMAVAVTVLLNRLVLNPLARLHHSTQALAAGDYGQLATVATNNEIGALTGAFNAMARTVRDQTEHLEQRVTERTRELDQAHRALASTHRQVVDSIQYAQMLQESILPGPERLEQVLGEHWVLWKPRDLVGGDFYYVHADDRGFLLVVADCTGHGVPGALMTMAVNAVLNHVVGTLGADDPPRILQAVNRLLRAMLRHDKMGEGFENGLDAGVCYGAWATPLLLFAGARVDLFYRDGNGAVTVVRGDGRSLGYRQSDPDWTFTEHRIERWPDRVFYLTTDGLLDQSGGPKGYGFGRKRFQEFLQQQGDRPLAVQKTALEQALAAWRGGQPQRDDMTAIGFRLAPQPFIPSP